MEITKSDIRKLIQNIKADSFWNHFMCVIKRDFSYNGEIQKSRIKVWKQGIWIGAFYPIFTFELDSQNHLISISDKLNPIGKFLYLLFPLCFSYPFISLIIIDFEIKKLLIFTLIALMVIAIYVLVATKIYKYEKGELLKEIYEVLEIEIEVKRTESEWSKNKILIRVFTYPFCIFLIFLNIFLIIPGGKIFLASGTLLIVFAYLYADLKIILKKTNKNQ